MKKIINILLIGGIAGSFLSVCKNVQSLNLNSHTSNDVSALLSKEFPMIPKETMVIEQNKDLNLWQVYALGQMMYVTPDLKYFIGGHYFKFGGDKVDLTQKYIDAKNIVDVKSLPLDLAITTKKGNGKNVFYVFSDPECPYCHLLQSEVVNKLDNSTIYTFLFPLPIHQSAYSDSIKLLCNNEPDKTFESWMSISPQTQEAAHDKYFASMKECDTGKKKVDTLLRLGQTLNIQGTPTIINVQGQKIGMKELAEMSQQQSQVVKVNTSGVK